MRLPVPAAAALAALAAVAALAVALRAGAAAEDEVYKNTFRSPTWGVEMVVPPDWELSRQRSFPGVLAYAQQHHIGARMTLAAQRLPDGETLETYLARNEQALRRVGFEVGAPARHPAGALVLEATSPNRRRRLRQAYLVNQGVAYVLSLSAPVAGMNRAGQAFTDTLRGLVLYSPAPLPDGGPLPPVPDARSPG